jgi:hypothetical protein
MVKNVLIGKNRRGLREMITPRAQGSRITVYFE